MKIWIKWIFIAGLGGFFLLAGISKLADTTEFTRAILRYQLVGPGLAWAGALWFPWVEVLSALSLASSRLRLSAIWILIGLLGIFECALLSAFWRGLDIDCGCLGTSGEVGVSFALMRNVFLVAGLVILAQLDRRSK